MILAKGLTKRPIFAKGENWAQIKTCQFGDFQSRQIDEKALKSA